MREREGVESDGSVGGEELRGAAEGKNHNQDILHAKNIFKNK